jgi:DNA-directed RNA polymerase specialized sigma24 family protein
MPACKLPPSAEADIGEPSATLAPVFVAAVDEHGPAVARIVRRCGVPDSERLDVASDVFFTAWGRRDTFDRRRTFKPWLLGIARRVCSDYRKHERTTQNIIVPGRIEDMAARDGLDPS